jgi:hypothetical protein
MAWPAARLEVDMTATLQISPAPTRPELALTELAEQDVDLLPDRETLCGYYCHPCYYYCHPCHPVFYCAPRWCYG